MKLTFTRGPGEVVATLTDDDGSTLNLAKHCTSEPFELATKYDDAGLPFFELKIGVLLDDVEADVEAVKAFGVPVTTAMDEQLAQARGEA